MQIKEERLKINHATSHGYVKNRHLYCACRHLSPPTCKSFWDLFSEQEWQRGVFKESGSLRFCLRPGHFLAVCIGLLRLIKQSTADWVAATTEINFLTVLEAESPKSRCWQVFLRSLSLACRRLASCCVLTWPFLCVCSSLVPLSSYRATSSLRLAPHLYDHLALITSVQALSPNTVTLLGCQYMNWRGGTI